MTSVSIGVWLASGYAIVLLLIGYLIDTMARRAARRVESDASGGFVYHEDHDAWLCPEDQWLWPQAFDPENRVMRYRGTPSICNACPVKDTCTTSSSGREVVKAVDSWPASEAARFHRGIAVSVAGLGVLWPIGMALSGPSVPELLVLLGALLIVLVGSVPLWSHLRRSPALFPEAVPAGITVQSLDESLAARQALATTQARRRAQYGSDRRSTREDQVS